ncbi:MAG TPA: hypothetical protein VLA72_12640 [Anaerolineales bacterium]|nr:hypothetical protein [Anaerolineales bacterium]
MKNRKLPQMILGVSLIVLLLVSCGTSQTAAPPTKSFTATAKPPQATRTPKPSATPTSDTLDSSIALVPRYMLPSSPANSVEVLGKICNYQRDEWNNQTAYIAYACPDLNVVWLSVRFTNLEEGETALDLFDQLPPEGSTLITPSDLLSKFDNMIISGSVEDSNYDYFLVYETKSYVISVEVFFPEDSTMTMEEFYPDNGEPVLHAVLGIILENTRSGGTVPESTPMAADQQVIYDQIAHWLVTETEANEFYKDAPDMFGDPFDGTWISSGDSVDTQRGSVCRVFEDRTNADAPLVALFNCVYDVGSDYDLEKILENRPAAVVLDSAYEYPENSIIYGLDLNNGHTSLNAFILHGEYLLYVFIESRTLVGQTPKNVFNEFNDGFIYNVLMTNLESYDLGDVLDDKSQEKDPFIGTWVATDPPDGSNMELTISIANDVHIISVYDDVATSCGLDSAGNPIPANATGTGIVSGNLLSVEISWYCLTNPQSFLATVSQDFIYNESNDTLSDSGYAANFPSFAWRRP